MQMDMSCFSKKNNTVLFGSMNYKMHGYNHISNWVFNSYYPSLLIPFSQYNVLCIAAYTFIVVSQGPLKKHA